MHCRIKYCHAHITLLFRMYMCSSWIKYCILFTVPSNYCTYKTYVHLIIVQNIHTCIHVHVHMHYTYKTGLISIVGSFFRFSNFEMLHRCSNSSLLCLPLGTTACASKSSGMSTCRSKYMCITPLHYIWGINPLPSSVLSILWQHVCLFHIKNLKLQAWT